MSTTLKLINVDVKALEKAIEPAVIVDNKITLNIDTRTGKIYGVAGGNDRYKFWSKDLSEICESFTVSEDFNHNYVVKTVILNTKGLIATMKVVGEKINVEMSMNPFIDVYDTGFLTLSKDKLQIKYACAPISIGHQDVSDEEKEKKLGSFGDTFEFKFTAEDLKRIKQLSDVQTLDVPVDLINFESSENGKLRVFNDVFDIELESEVSGMNEHKFLIELFKIIDNDNYDVAISRMPNGVPKIVFKSTDRDIQFVCSMLVSSDTFADSNDIEKEFESFQSH